MKEKEGSTPDMGAFIVPEWLAELAEKSNVPLNDIPELMKLMKKSRLAAEKWQSLVDEDGERFDF